MRVWLYPNTKAAGRNCYLGLAAEIVESPISTWPMVLVKHKKGEELVHRNNLRSTPPGIVSGQKKEGDGTNQTISKATIKPAFRPHPSLVPGDYEEPMLF